MEIYLGGLAKENVIMLTEKCHVFRQRECRERVVERHGEHSLILHNSLRGARARRESRVEHQTNRLAVAADIERRKFY